MSLLAALALIGLQLGAPVKLADGFDPATAGLAWMSSEHELIAWSANGVKVFRYGSKAPVECGLSGLQDVISIAPDGFEYLAILTRLDAELWVNRGGTFKKLNVFLPEGAYKKAVWLDYDHDGAPDLFLLGDKSVLLRNDGAGFTNVSNNFPFVQGRAVNGAAHGSDLVVTYSDRPPVRYVDRMGGRYEAEELNTVPPALKDTSLAIDYDGDGRTDLIEIGTDGSLVFRAAIN